MYSLFCSVKEFGGQDRCALVVMYSSTSDLALHFGYGSLFYDFWNDSRNSFPSKQPCTTIPFRIHQFHKFKSLSSLSFIIMCWKPLGTKWAFDSTLMLMCRIRCYGLSDINLSYSENHQKTKHSSIHRVTTSETTCFGNYATLKKTTYDQNKIQHDACLSLW